MPVGVYLQKTRRCCLGSGISNKRQHPHTQSERVTIGDRQPLFTDPDTNLVMLKGLRRSLNGSEGR